MAADLVEEEDIIKASGADSAADHSEVAEDHSEVAEDHLEVAADHLAAHFNKLLVLVFERSAIS